MRFSAVLVLLTLAPPLLAAPAKLDKKACFKLAEDGQDLRTESKLRESRAKFLECASDACPDVVRKDCTKWAGEVEAEIPSIAVRVTKEGEDVPIARVTVDGVDAAYVDGKAISLDPGTRKLVIEPKGEAPIETSVIVVAGEKNRAVTVKVPVVKGESPPPTTAPKTTAPPVVAPESRTWPWIFVGVGAVGLGGFGYFALSGRSDVNKLEDRGCEPNCPDDDVSSIKRKFLIGDIALGISIVSLGIATYGFLSTPAKKDAPSVSLKLGPGFAALQGSF
jgi:hypothetical protein